MTCISISLVIFVSKIEMYLFIWGKGVGVFLPVSASLGLKVIEKLTPEELPRKNELTLGPDI